MYDDGDDGDDDDDDDDDNDDDGDDEDAEDDLVMLPILMMLKITCRVTTPSCHDPLLLFLLPLPLHPFPQRRCFLHLICLRCSTLKLF